jgi:hypothetical protein
MNNRIRLVPVIVLLFLLAPCAAAVAQPPLQPARQSTPAKGLAKWLKKRGYVALPMKLNKTGLLDVQAEVEGLHALLVVDTGCNNINLDRSIARRAKLAVKEVEGKTATFSATVATGRAKIAKLSVGNVSDPADTYVVDFALVNAMRKEHGDSPCDGTLGGSFLTYYSAVIDYPHLKLYLLNPEYRARNLAKPLKKAGFTEVSMEHNKSGLLDVKVDVTGMPMLPPDTPASSKTSVRRKPFMLQNVAMRWRWA